MITTLLLLLQAATGAELVAPGVINTAADEYGPTLTADGRTMYFTRRVDRAGRENIVMSRLGPNGWSVPEIVTFSGQGEDKEPYLAPDGRLYFASRRAYPGKAPAEGEEAYDLFVVEWTGADWGEPRPLTGANSATHDNYPAVAANGSLYFASQRPGGAGGNDLWRAARVDGSYHAATNLTSLNSPHSDADPFIAPDESYMVFSSGRLGGLGQGDLYVSFRRRGRWTEPRSLGPLVNTDDYEYTPWITSDGRWLYFSRGWGEIWRIETRLVEALWAR
jgi:Tol biopolymer transport system component